MFVPDGEALIHQYYNEAIARLCEKDAIKKIGCQTNLSFSVKDFLASFDSVSDYRSKLRLWCSFHPSQTSLGSFLEKCKELYQNGICFSVGAVGIQKHIELLEELRRQLPDDIYFWLNAVEGSRIKYTQSEIDSFLAIDPLFSHELAEYQAKDKFCLGGKESIFVEESGDVFACVISRKKLGNIYTGNFAGWTRCGYSDSLRNAPQVCQAAKCHCYLAYSNRTDVFDVNGLNAERAFRVPKSQKVFFFDIDGTLTDASGIIPADNIKTIERLAQKSLIFLATSLPYRFAEQSCKDIWRYIAGGVFAEGSDIRIFAENYKRVIPLNESAKTLPADTNALSLSDLLKQAPFAQYREDSVLHKIALSNTPEKPCFPGFEFSEYHCVFENDTYGIVSKDASKLNGILEIIKHLQIFEPFVTVVGNGQNDIPMLRHFSNSVCIPDSDIHARNSAKRVCAITGLGK